MPMQRTFFQRAKRAFRQTRLMRKIRLKRVERRRYPGSLKALEAYIRRNKISGELAERMRQLANPAAYVRWRAVLALGELKDIRAVPPLIQKLTDPNVQVRLYAAEALGALKDVRAVPPLIQKLADPKPYVRGSAAKALGNLAESLAANKPEVLSVLHTAKERWKTLEEGRRGVLLYAIVAKLEVLKDFQRDPRQYHEYLVRARVSSVEQLTRYLKLTQK